RGSLGALEDVSVRLAGLAGCCPPPLPEPACVAVFAADHGVHAQGVTPWPQEVTAQMVANFLAGGAVVNAFAAQAGAEVTVVDVGTYAKKIDVVCRGLDRHKPDPADPVGVLAAFGGFEHAALAGFILGAAALRVPVILDGVIAGAAALAAVALAPDAAAACFAGHRTAEPGHAVTLSYLGPRPPVDLGLRLGEGTGAVLALPLVQSAARALRDVATFDSAGVADKH